MDELLAYAICVVLVVCVFGFSTDIATNCLSKTIQDNRDGSAHERALIKNSIVSAILCIALASTLAALFAYYLLYGWLISL